MFEVCLPQHDGFLHYYLLYVSSSHRGPVLMIHYNPSLSNTLTPQCSISALAHSAVTYLNPISSLRQFAGPSAPPPNSLLAHVYGIKNIYTGLIRFYAAYHVGNPQLYTLAQWTFAGVLVLYLGELVIWQTVRLKEGAIPLVTAGLGLLWMVVYRDWYLS